MDETSPGRDRAEWEHEQRRFQAQVVLGDDATPPDFAVWAHRRWAAREAAGWSRSGRLLVAAASGVPMVLALWWASQRYGAAVTAVVAAAALAIEVVIVANVGRRLQHRFRQHGRPDTVVALYRSPPSPADAPVVVVAVTAGDAARLPLDGAVAVIGDVAVSGHLGIVDRDYVIWPVEPPRSPAPQEPTWGAEPTWES